MKPKPLEIWEARCESLRAEIPRICVTCAHHAPRETTDDLYCRRFEEHPPLDFQEAEQKCNEWSSILDEIPF